MARSKRDWGSAPQPDLGSLRAPCFISNARADASPANGAESCGPGRPESKMRSAACAGAAPRCVRAARYALEPPRSPLPACPGACARENGSESVSSPTRVGLRQQCARRGEPGQWAKSCGPRRPESKMCAVRHALSRPGRHSLLPWCVGPSQPKIHAPASQLRLLPRRGGGFPP
jgi:hypothetical protein